MSCNRLLAKIQGTAEIKCRCGQFNYFVIKSEGLNPQTN
ncbi:hypothetical protein ACWNS2_00125 [Planococcus plakortidis]